MGHNNIIASMNNTRRGNILHIEYQWLSCKWIGFQFDLICAYASETDILDYVYENKIHFVSWPELVLKLSMKSPTRMKQVLQFVLSFCQGSAKTQLIVCRDLMITGYGVGVMKLHTF